MSTKIPQEQLRKFMKEKRENLKSQKIESPFAKYSNSGQLSCSICNTVIKTSNLWVTHISGKHHKENLLKNKKSSTDTLPKSNALTGIKRTVKQNDATKKVNCEGFKVPQVPQKGKQTAATSLLDGYSSSSSDDDDLEDDANSKVKILPDETHNSLPPNFFDSSVTNDVLPESASKPLDQKESKSKKSNNVDSLPEGFFDDPILDAKARNIEYKDPVEEEWEKFQRSIAEETTLSKSIIEEDLQESIIERDIAQIDEQIHQWERKNNLELLVESVKKKEVMMEVGENGSCSSSEDLDEEDLLDWRLKSIKKV